MTEVESFSYKFEYTYYGLKAEIVAQIYANLISKPNNYNTGVIYSSKSKATKNVSYMFCVIIES